MFVPLVTVITGGSSVSMVRPFQLPPLSPKELRASKVTEAVAPSTTGNALLPTVGAEPRNMTLFRLLHL